jgi:hypothetical protein
MFQLACVAVALMHVHVPPCTALRCCADAAGWHDVPYKPFAGCMQPCTTTQTLPAAMYTLPAAAHRPCQKHTACSIVGLCIGCNLLRRRCLLPQVFLQTAMRTLRCCLLPAWIPVCW